MHNPFNQCAHCCEAVEIKRLHNYVACAYCGTAIRVETEKQQQFFARIEEYAKAQQISEGQAVESLIEIALNYVGQSRKVVINVCYGGFCISELAAEQIAKRKSIPLSEVNIHKMDREDPDLIWAVETLGNDSGTAWSKLKVVSIPNNVQYTIVDYDGVESVHEVHRKWR